MNNMNIFKYNFMIIVQIESIFEKRCPIFF